jgi:hypothetical protein
MSTYRFALLLACAAASLSSCEENTPPTITGPDPGARIKFFNFGVNARSVNFFANDVKLTAVGSTTGTESTTGTTYANAALGGLYASIAPGQYTFEGKIPGTDSTTSSISTSVAMGEHYSYYQSGFFNDATKTVEAFLVEDPLPPAIDFAVAHVRLVHAISNANPLTLYARNTQDTTQLLTIGGAVAYKGAGAFTAIPGGIYDLYARYTGSPTNVFTRTAVTFLAGRVYTVTAFGDITVTSTTATNRPRFDVTANR